MTSTAYIFDGMFAETLGRRLQALHNSWYIKDTTLDADERTTLSFMEYIILVTCVAHGASNSIPWALSLHSSDEILSDVHIVIESLRKTALAVYETIPEFMIRYVVCDHVVEESEKEVWTTLRVKEKMLDAVVEVAPRWDGRVVNVNTKILNKF